MGGYQEVRTEEKNSLSSIFLGKRMVRNYQLLKKRMKRPRYNFSRLVSILKTRLSNRQILKDLLKYLHEKFS